MRSALRRSGRTDAFAVAPWCARSTEPPRLRVARVGRCLPSPLGVASRRRAPPPTAKPFLRTRVESLTNGLTMARPSGPAPGPLMKVVIPPRALRACGPPLRPARPRELHLKLQGEADARLKCPPRIALTLREVEMLNAGLATRFRLRLPHGASFITISADGRVQRKRGP